MIRIKNLTVAYQRHPAIHHVSGTFAEGSLTAIVGPNGAGKSSLLAALVGHVTPTTGSIEIATQAQGRVAYLPQQSEIDRSFPISVLDVVMLGHWGRAGAFASINSTMREKGFHALAAVGLTGFEKRLIGDLSVGQFQRVLFARVLLQDAAVILLDEPFNAIDARTTADLLAVVQRWHQHQRTVIAVLHDLDQVREHFPNTLLLAREVVAWGATQEALCAENLMRARQMAEHWDEQARWCKQA